MNLNKVLFIVMLTGFVILALPDTGTRIFSISKEHGPSLQDLIGLVLILLPYSYFLIKTWKKRKKITLLTNSVFFLWAIFLLGLGAGLIIASVAGDHPYWWIYGAVLMALVQSVVFYHALRKNG